MTGDTSRGDRLEIRQEGITRLKLTQLSMPSTFSRVAVGYNQSR